MKKIFVPACIVILFSCTKSEINKSTQIFSDRKFGITQSPWQLVWSEEFNYNGLPDSSKWTYETGYVRNNEPQYYIAGKKANSKVSNGSLKITALYYSLKQPSLTSASITTKNKMNFLYGRIEVRAKMPVGSGAWPAIWLLGVNRDTAGWPSCGEIDILEWLGQYPQYILGSIYTVGSTRGDTSHNVTPYVPLDSATLSTKFHVYAIEWDSSSIKYFYDNINYAVYNESDFTPEEWQPFTKPMYLLLNLAMGVSGGPIDYSKFPFVYQVDYVRYYKNKFL